jgi:peptidoglycan/xylan/chitin deacetylase (PgdA/CDA1 family)
MEYKVRMFRKSVFIIFLLGIMAVLTSGLLSLRPLIHNLKWQYVKQVYVPSWKYELQNNPYFNKGQNTAAATVINQKTEALPVLLYHGIVERDDGSNIMVDNFRDQMFALKAAGYQTITLDDFQAFMKGDKDLPDKSFLLTFDDGRKDSYYPVDPILRALDYNAVMFVISRYVNVENDNFYLSKDELSNMLASKRWDLEVHTKDGHDMAAISSDGAKGHYYTNKLWNPGTGLESDREYKERIFNDISSAKNDLANNFSIKPKAFAFPFGDFGLNSVNYPESKNIMLDIAHYAFPMSFYQITLGSGFMYNYIGENDYLFKRIDVQSEWSPDDLFSILRAGHPKALPFTDDFSHFNGWLTSSGTNQLNSGSLSLKAPPDSSSGTLFLDGSKAWKNYAFNTEVNWKKGDKLSLFARYKFDSNYLACEVSDQYLQLISQFDDKNEMLKEVMIPRSFPHNNLNVSLQVRGNEVTCALNNYTKITYSGIRNEQASGGIGFKISGNELGSAEMAINNVTVDDLDNPIAWKDNFVFNPFRVNNFLSYNRQ